MRGRTRELASDPPLVGGEKVRSAFARWEAAEVVRTATRAQWRSGALLTSSANLGLSTFTQPGWSLFVYTSSRRVAVEWVLDVRVVMAGYEYVSPEQLAGFDKYKVVRAPRTPLYLLAPASPRRLRGRRGPCHLVPRGSGRAGGRFSRGLGAWGAPKASLRLSTLPGDCLFLRRPLRWEWSGRIPFASVLHRYYFLAA